MIFSNTAPDYLHFVWFGENLITKKAPMDGSDPSEGEEEGANMGRLIRWAISNPKYQVCLWTDSSSLNSVKKELDRHRNGGEEIPLIEIKNFDDEEFSHVENSAELKKLVSFFRNPTQNTLDEFLGVKNKTQITKEAKQNYGAASDLVRGMVLQKFGGIYLDFDSESVEDKASGKYVALPALSELLNEKQPVRLGHNPRGKQHDFVCISNDVIASRFKEPIISSYLKESLRLSFENGRDILNSIVSRDSELRLQSTTSLGPALLRCVFIKDFLEKKDLNIEYQNPDPSIPFYRKKPESIILPLYYEPRFSDIIQLMYREALKEAGITNLAEMVALTKDFFRRGKANSWGTWGKNELSKPQAVLSEDVLKNLAKYTEKNEESNSNAVDNYDGFWGPSDNTESWKFENNQEAKGKDSDPDEFPDSEEEERKSRTKKLKQGKKVKNNDSDLVNNNLNISAQVSPNSSASNTELTKLKEELRPLLGKIEMLHKLISQINDPNFVIKRLEAFPAVTSCTELLNSMHRDLDQDLKLNNLEQLKLQKTYMSNMLTKVAKTQQVKIENLLEQKGGEVKKATKQEGDIRDLPLSGQFDQLIERQTEISHLLKEQSEKISDSSQQSNNLTSSPSPF